MTGATTQCTNLLIRREINHSHTFIHCWRSNGSNLGLSVLPKDTSTCGLEEPGIKPPIFQLEDGHSTSWATAAHKKKRKGKWESSLAPLLLKWCWVSSQPMRDENQSGLPGFGLSWIWAFGLGEGFLCLSMWRKLKLRLWFLQTGLRTKAREQKEPCVDVEAQHKV